MFPLIAHWGAHGSNVGKLNCRVFLKLSLFKKRGLSGPDPSIWLVDFPPTVSDYAEHGDKSLKYARYRLRYLDASLLDATPEEPGPFQEPCLTHPCA